METKTIQAEIRIPVGMEVDKNIGFRYQETPEGDTIGIIVPLKPVDKNQPEYVDYLESALKTIMNARSNAYDSRGLRRLCEATGAYFDRENHKYVFTRDVSRCKLMVPVGD